MPLGHAVMILMDKFLPEGALHVAGFCVGLVGLILVIIGVLVKGDTRQTLFGLFGGMLFWTGWVEFLFQYYANRYGVQPEIVNGEIVTRPEYLILPATFGIWVMMAMIYIFCTRTGCVFFNWCQKTLLGKKRDIIVTQPMTRHSSIVTFLELNMIMWTCYLVLMFCYDPHFLGDHHPVTMIVGALCFIAAIFIFIRQLKLPSWGANIRMAIATVVVFWTPVEILGRLNFFSEIWIAPLEHLPEMIAILCVFVALAVYVIVAAARKNKTKVQSKE